MSPAAPEVPGLPRAEFGAEHANLPGSSEAREIARSMHTTPDDSFIKHDAYYFKDGNVTFLVDGTLYCVHRYFFSRDSVYFSTRFSQLNIRDHEALPTIIPIDDLERKDFEALLSVLYPVNFGAYELTYEQWRSILHLSTHWGFPSLRELALKSIAPTPHDQLVLARTYSVDHWVLPALTALCERPLPLSLDEARQMSMGDVVLVARVREEIRGSTLQVDAADIRRHIEVAQAEKLNHTVGDDIQRDAPNNEATAQKFDSTVASGIDRNVGAKITETVGVASPPETEPQRAGMKEGDTHVDDAKDSSKEEVPAESQGEDARRKVEQPHVMEGTPQDYLEKSVATSAVQASETRQPEGASRKATACPSAQVGAVLAENSAMGTMARLDVEVEVENARRLEAEAAKECAAKAEEKARKEAARAKEEADAKVKKAAVEAEAKVKREAEARIKAEAVAKAKREAEARAEAEAAARAKREVEARAEAEAAAKAKREAEARDQAEAMAKARREAEARAEAEAVAKAKREAEARAEAEAAARAKREVEARAEAEAAAKAKRETEARAEAEAKLKAEAEDRELTEAFRARAEVLEAVIEAEMAKTEALQVRFEAFERAMANGKARGETTAEAMAKEARDRKLKLLSPVTDAWGKIIECENCSNHAVGALHYCSQRYMKCDRCRRGRERFEFFRECDTCPGTPVNELSQEGGETASKSGSYF